MDRLRLRHSLLVGYLSKPIWTDGLGGVSPGARTGQLVHRCTRVRPKLCVRLLYACGSASTLAKVSRDEFEAWPPTCLTLAMPLTLRFFLALLPNRIL